MNEIVLDQRGLEVGQGHTSKGDQPKWCVEDIWYKADHMGTEALSEVVVSSLLAHSNQDNFVMYQPTSIISNGEKLIGCFCKNFLDEDERLVPLERLHRIQEGISLAQYIGWISTPLERIEYTVSFVERVTGLGNFGSYLAAILAVDAFFLNEDRHTNNLAVVYNERTKKYRTCPIFDNGLSLLSDMHDYPLEKDMYQCIKEVRAKPFSLSFVEQIEAADVLYGDQLEFYFTKKDVLKIINFLKEYYDEKVLNRIVDVIFEQMRRYSYMIRKKN